MSFDVFISYSTKDAPTAKAACAALEAEKIRCWMAPRDISPGAPWGASIVHAIDQCRVMVLIFSANANGSRQVHREVNRAFSKGVTVVPLRIENVTPADDLAYYLDTVHWLDALTPPLERGLQQLTATVQALLARAAPVAPVAPSEETVLDEAEAARAEDEARAEDKRRQEVGEAEQRAAMQAQRGRERRLSRRSVLIGGAVVGAGAAAVVGVATRTRQRPPAPAERNYLIRTFTGHTGEIRSVAIAPDGRTSLSGSEDHTLRLWDLGTGRTIRIFDGHTQSVNCVAIAPDGRTALSGSSDKTLRLWDLTNVGDLAGESAIRTLSGSDFVTCVAIAPDGRTALSGDNSYDDPGGLRLWDLAAGSMIRTIDASEAFFCVAIAPDGHTALSGGYSNTLRLWDLANFRVIRSFNGHHWPIDSVSIAPDGRTALSGSEYEILLWDLVTASTLSVPKDYDISSPVAIAHDGRTALSQGADDLLLWDIASSNITRRFPGKVNCVAFAPDGRSALSGSDDKTLKLWDLT